MGRFKLSDEVENMNRWEMIDFVRDNRAGVDAETDKKIMEIVYKLVYSMAMKNKIFHFLNLPKSVRQELVNDCSVNIMIEIFNRLSSTPIINIASYLNEVFQVLFFEYLEVFFYRNPKQYKTIPNAKSVTLITIGEWWEDTIEDFHRAEVDVSYKSFYKLVRDNVKRLPHKDEIEYKNLYISVMLTILNIIRIPREDIYRIQEVFDGDLQDCSLTARMIMYKSRQNTKYEQAVLYHVDEKLNGLVNIVARISIRNFLKDMEYHTKFSIDALDYLDDCMTEDFKDDKELYKNTSGENY